MDFEFSADQLLVRDSIRRMLGDRAPISWVREHYGAARCTPSSAWQSLADLGMCGLLIADSFGGAGMGMVDAAPVLEELGRAVCISPYASSAIGAAYLIGAAGTPSDHAQLLPGLAAGTIVGTVAVYEPGRRYGWRDPSTRVGTDSEITGVKTHVADASDADLLLVGATAADGEFGVYVVDAHGRGVAVEPIASVDGSNPEATVTFEGALGQRLSAAGASHVATMLDLLATAACVDAVGAAARALELVVEYATTRVAFDKPIGSFQAVQHLCADMLRAVELARAAAYYACWAADAAPPEEAHRAATIAAAYVSEALPQLGGTAIQVFAGVGFTWEHDIHLYFKRLLTAGYRAGTADHHLHELARLVI